MWRLVCEQGRECMSARPLVVAIPLPAQGVKGPPASGCQPGRRTASQAKAKTSTNACLVVHLAYERLHPLSCVWRTLCIQ